MKLFVTCDLWFVTIVRNVAKARVCFLSSTADVALSADNFNKSVNIVQYRLN